MNPTAGVREEEGRPSVLWKRSHPDSESQVKVTIYDSAGTTWTFLLTIGEQLDAAAVAAVTGLASFSYFLSNPTTEQTYHPWLGESYTATATETDPVLILMVLDSSVAKTIEAIVRLSEELQDAGIYTKLEELGPLICDSQSDIRSDFHVAITAVTLLHGGSLVVFSSDLRNDPVIVLAAVKQYGCALQLASTYLKDNRDVVMAAVTKTAHSLWNASPRLKDNRDVAMAAVTQDGLLLDKASLRLQDDRKIVMAAVTQNGHALKHASPRLQDDRDVVMAAVTQKWACVEAREPPA
jgi:hypothetical protein